MTAAAQVLGQLARIGATVSRDGDQLRLRAGPVPVPAGLVAQVRAVKPELLVMLARPPLQLDKTPRPEPERLAWDAADWRAFYDERAAIREYDGRRPRAEAERLGWGEVLSEWHKAHGVPPPTWQCAGCGKPLSGAVATEVWDGARVHDAPDHACLIAYGRHWRAAAAKALATLGIEGPKGWEP